jgi:hypothetical protein
MKLLSLLTLTLFLQTFGFSQSNNKSEAFDKKEVPPNKLVGTWRLIEYSDLDSISGEWKYKYGKNPKGYFTYTNTNIVNLNITTETPFKFSIDSAKLVQMNYYEMIQKNSLGYFGTYSVDWEKSIVTHHVKGGSLPWYIDTDQPRQFTIKGDTVIIGDNKTWRRVLVKAD